MVRTAGVNCFSNKKKQFEPNGGIKMKIDVNTPNGPRADDCNSVLLTVFAMLLPVSQSGSDATRRVRLVPNRTQIVSVSQ